MTTDEPIEGDVNEDVPAPGSVVDAEYAAPRVLPAPKPGLYKGVPYHEYAAWDAVRASTLIELRRTPAHAYHKLLAGGEDDETPARRLGHLTHLAVLEPERFKDEAILVPQVDRRTKAGKAQWAEFQTQAEGRMLVLPKQWDEIVAMQQALYAHPTAGELLRSEGATEVSLVWTDRRTGVLCKARLDKIGTVGTWPLIGDLKTDRDASRHGFERSIMKYGYHIQSAHYLDGVETLAPVAPGEPYQRFVWMVAEKDEPRLVACYEMAEEAIEIARRERQRLLELYKKCSESGEWPGYDDGVDLVSLPQWAMKAAGEIEDDEPEVED